MSDDRKRILSPLTRCKKACKRKAWHKTREKYIPVEGRQNLAETDRGIILQRGMDRRIFRQPRCILQW